MPTDVFPLRIRYDPRGLQCVVHCPHCDSELITDACSSAAVCHCGAELRIVVDRRLYGAILTAACVR